MFELFSRLIFLIMVNCQLSEAADSFLTLGAKKNLFQLNGAHLKFAVAHVPPINVLTMGPDGKYTHTGSSALFIDWLAAKLNFTYSYYHIPNNMTKAKYGNMSDFAILFNLVVKKEVDGLAVPAIATPERKNSMDFGYIIWTEPHAILVPRRGEEPRLFAFIRPFQHSVWLFIFFTMLAVMFFMTVFTTIHSRILLNKSGKLRSNLEARLTIWQTASTYAIYVTNTITNQGGSVPCSRLSFRILLGAWLLAAMVLINCYSGTVVSYLTAPRVIPSINSMEDLAASEDVGVLVLGNSLIGQQIIDAHSGALKILGDQIRRNPDRILTNMLKVDNLLETGHYALPYFQTFCDDFVARTFKKEGNCRFKTTDPITMSGFWCLPLQKDSKFTPEIYLAQLKAWDVGLPQHWVKISIQQAPKCYTKNRPDASRKVPIRINDIFGAFLILGVGIGIATPIFLRERIPPAT